jgi:dephospho-CoA kinase
MLSIGLTGGIGSGKTLISRVFSHLFIPIYYADDRAKELYKQKKVIDKLVSSFGECIMVNDCLDKKKLANIVFNDISKLRLLDSIIHPLVRQDYEDWKIKQDAPYVIMESAIIFESNWQEMFDKVICVYTPKEIAIERVMKRDESTREQVEHRMENQMSSKAKKDKSDFVVIHDNDKMIIPQILTIDKQLRSLI